MLLTHARVVHRQSPLTRPIKTSFGSIATRHLILLAVGDEQGYVGLGESWVNFPAWAPWERAAAYERAIIPYLIGREVADVPAFVKDLYAAFRGPAVQSGTVAPLVSAICGVELALWDLEARRQGLPVSQLWFEQPANEVQLYGSGISHPIPWQAIDELLDQGITVFKLKMGFGDSRDRENLHDLTRHLGTRASIAVDVNRAWTLQQALEWLPVLADHGVRWLEEPLTPADELQLAILRDASQVPIAGAENAIMEPGCDVQQLAGQPLDIFQPDITKYCPLHVALRLLPALQERTLCLYPHFLGSAPGQAAVFHFAAGCGKTLVEWDVNANPLRTDLLTPPFKIEDGIVALPERPGLGWELPHS